MGDTTNDSLIILTGAADNIIIGWKNYAKLKIYEG